MQIDPIIVRVVWLATVFWGGAGVLAYILAMVIIPVEHKGTEIPTSHSGGRLALGLLLILLGLFFVLKRHLPFMFFWWPEPYLWLPIGLILTGIVILMLSRPRELPDVDKLLSKEGAVREEPSALPSDSGSGADSDPHPGRLWRSRRERVILGICGGIGLRYSIDPVLIRLIWVFATLVTHGIGLVVYLLLFFLIPIEPLRAVYKGEISRA